MEKFKKYLVGFIEDQKGSVSPEMARYIGCLGYVFIGAGVLLGVIKMLRKKPETEKAE